MRRALDGQRRLLASLRLRAPPAAAAAAAAAASTSSAALLSSPPAAETQSQFVEDRIYTQGSSSSGGGGGGGSGASFASADLLIAPAVEGARGRGVVARRGVSVGQLLLWAPALVLQTAAAEQQPTPDQLAAALVGAARDAATGPLVRRTLAHLYDGSDASCAAVPDMRALLLEQQQPPGGGDDAGGGGCATSGGCGHDHHDHHYHHHGHHTGEQQQQQQEPPPPLDEAAARRVVQLNAYGDDYEDLAAAATRGAPEPHAFCGVFPAMALLNHSCLASAVHYGVDRHVVVRAVADVPAAGHELTISYLGREDFAPAAARRRALRDRFGFECACERCRLEDAAPPALRAELERVYACVVAGSSGSGSSSSAAVVDGDSSADGHAAAAAEGGEGSLKREFVRAVERQDQRGVARVAAELAALEASLARQLQGALDAGLLAGSSSSSASAALLQASVYDLYELLLFCEQLLDGGDLQLQLSPAGNNAGNNAGAAAGRSSGEASQRVLARLGRCLAIVATTSRGSELHCFLASRALQHARGSEAAEAAAALLQEAMLARYGAPSGPVLMALMEANKAASEEFLL